MVKDDDYDYLFKGELNVAARSAPLPITTKPHFHFTHTHHPAAPAYAYGREVHLFPIFRRISVLLVIQIISAPLRFTIC